MQSLAQYSFQDIPIAIPAPLNTIPDQILQSVENSRRTVIVLSNNYLRSMWSMMEFQAAHVKTMEENVQVTL